MKLHRCAARTPQIPREIQEVLSPVVHRAECCKMRCETDRQSAAEMHPFEDERNAQNTIHELTIALLSLRRRLDFWSIARVALPLSSHFIGILHLRIRNADVLFPIWEKRHFTFSPYDRQRDRQTDREGKRWRWWAVRCPTVGREVETVPLLSALWMRRRHLTAAEYLLIV
jgi:hypothetical protein